MRNRNRNKAIWLALAVALSFPSVGCGKAGKCKRTCKDRAECKEGDNLYVEDEDVCKDTCIEDLREAKDASCKSEFNDYVDCVSDNFSCDGSDIGEKCNELRGEYTECLE